MLSTLNHSGSSSVAVHEPDYNVRNPEECQKFFDETRAEASRKKIEYTWAKIVILEQKPTLQSTIDSNPIQGIMLDAAYLHLTEKRFERALQHWDDKMRAYPADCGQMSAIFYSHMDANGKQALSNDMAEPDQVERLRKIKHKIATEFAPKGNHCTWRLLKKLNDLTDANGVQKLLDGMTKLCNEIRQVDPEKVPDDEHLLALLSNGIKTPTFQNYLLLGGTEMTYKKAFHQMSEWCTNQPELDINANSAVSVCGVVNGDFVPRNWGNGHCYQCGSTDHGVRECTVKGNCNRCGKPHDGGVFKCPLGYKGNPYFAFMKDKGGGTSTIPKKDWNVRTKAVKTAKVAKNKAVIKAAKAMVKKAALAAGANSPAPVNLIDPSMTMVTTSPLSGPSVAVNSPMNMSASIMQAVTAAIQPVAEKLNNMDDRLRTHNI